MAMTEKEVLEVIEESRLDGRTALDLRGCGLTLLPAEIGGLSNLTRLDLRYNQLTSLPAEIGGLSNLTTLNLGDNQLTSLPAAIGKLSNLTELNLGRNQLTILPTEIGRLTSLTRLFLRENQLKILPTEIGKLTSLTKLHLSRNRLTTLPVEIGDLASLKGLNLDGNRLTTHPAEIGKLSSLTRLDLSNNQLAILPAEIGKLTSLTTLYLSKNQLTILPAEIGKLTRLTRLCLRENQLAILPTEIGKLISLTTLNLSGNQLSELPEWLSELKNLSELYLHENEGLGLPAEVLGPSRKDVRRKKAEPAMPGDILDYYFRTRQGQRRPLNEAKLILVGHGDVGKTSLVNRLIYNYFNKDEPKTPGIKITQWPIELNGDEKVRLNVWDFGGQEMMHSTHQFFLSRRSVYLLVLNGRGGHEDSDAEYWLNLIESFGGDSPVIVVLNKIKGHPFDLNRRGLRQKYPGIRRFVETDCADEEVAAEPVGIEELREAIFRETDELEGLRDAFPAEWFAIKDELAGMEDNYLTFEEYRGVCARLGEQDAEEQDRLARYMHNLGVALNFKEDRRLRDMHVLNPHWVTNGIYTILNSRQLSEQKGELRVRDLGEILDRKKYPPERHLFLMELMRKFELCFQFPEGDGHYLVPELLAKDEAEEAAEFEKEECLGFEYHYPVLPEGLLPRFIVRSHVLGREEPRWRTGAILRMEGCEALVKADREAKRVYVRVRGPVGGGARRRLLAVIRWDFEHIHSSFTFEPVEMVPVPGYPGECLEYKRLLVMEEKRVERFPHVIGDDVVELVVKELLDDVDMEGVRGAERKRGREDKAIRVFYSYCHKDETLRNNLETHLKLMQRQGVITVWHDRRISGGQEWKNEIDDNLERADIILLLVSADFIASDYCYDVEMGRAMERDEAGEARVVPVIVRDVDWADAPFAKLQALPTDGKAVTLWEDKDSAWRDVSEGIKKIVRELMGEDIGEDKMRARLDSGRGD